LKNKGKWERSRLIAMHWPSLSKHGAEGALGFDKLSQAQTWGSASLSLSKGGAQR
jgi:hypothetical protein